MCSMQPTIARSVFYVTLIVFRLLLVATQLGSPFEKKKSEDQNLKSVTET